MSYAFEVARARCVIDLMYPSTESLLTDLDVRVGLVDVTTNRAARRAVREHPARLLPSWTVDPNRGMESVHELLRAVEDYGVRAACITPATLVPAVPIDDRLLFPVYAKCTELGLPVFVEVGIPAEPVPMNPQKVERLDEVCSAFPELTLVTRHGGEPWTRLLVHLMRKWPNLYSSTSDVKPAALSSDLVEYANTDGAEKLLFASGSVSAVQALEELPKVEFHDHVWAPLLHANAMRLFDLPTP